MNKLSQKIGFFNEGKYFKNHEGLVFSSDIFIIFLQKLLRGKSLKMIGRLSTIEFFPKYLLDDNSDFVPLTYYKSISKLLLIFPYYFIKNRKAIDNFIEKIDILFISASGPLSILMLFKIRKKNKKAVIFIRQNTRKLISAKHNGNFLSRITSNMIETYLENYVKNYSNCTVFSFGSEIHKRYIKLSKSTFSIADSRIHEFDVLMESSLIKLDYSTIKFLYVGRLAPGKGLEFLITALSKIKYFKFTLTIIGDGAIKSDLIDLVQKYNLNEQVIFKGHIYFSKKLLLEYSSHDVFVLPSFSEGFPQVIIEAMSRGILVVATKVGGIPDQIENNKNGFLFTPGNEKEFLKIINQINKNKTESLFLRKNAIKLAKKYTFENQSKIIFGELGFLHKKVQQ